MLNMKTKKPTKPTLEIPEITDDAGLSSPNHPASTPTSRPNGRQLVEAEQQEPLRRPCASVATPS
jgi:hypothetical protein